MRSYVPKLNTKLLAGLRTQTGHQTGLPSICPNLQNVQSGASSQAKHGGAYFSAVCRSIKDPIVVPGWHEVPGV